MTPPYGTPRFCDLDGFPLVEIIEPSDGPPSFDPFTGKVVTYPKSIRRVCPRYDGTHYGRGSWVRIGNSWVRP